MDFRIEEQVAQAWHLFTAKALDHIIAAIVISALSCITLGVLSGPLLVGYLRYIDRQRRGEPTDLNMLFSGFDRFATSLAVCVIVGVGVAIGSVFFVLPGLVLLLGWGHALWFVAFEDQPTFAALGSSWSLLREHTWPVLAVFLVVAVIVAAGIVTALGFIVALPMSVLVISQSFAQLTHQAKSNPQPAAT